MVRNLGSIAAGLLAMMFLWMLLMGLLFLAGREFAPDEFVLPVEGEEAKAPEGIGWLLATLGVDAVAAALGGLVVAILATSHRWKVVKITAGLLAAACALQVLGDAGRLPLWLPVARTVVAPAALLLAARCWLGRPAAADGEASTPSRKPGSGSLERPDPQAPVSEDM